MRILIHERYGSGHRMMAVRLLLDALLEVDAELGERNRDPDGDTRSPPALHITFSTRPDTPRSPQYVEHVAPLAGRFELVLVEEDEIGGERRSALDTARTNLRDLDALLAARDVDRLYVPYADTLLQLLAIRSFVPFARRWPAGLESEGLMMRTRFAYAAGPDLRALLGRLALSRTPFGTVHLIDAAAHRHVLDTDASLGEHVRLMPDPVNETRARDRDEARRALDLPVDGRLLGIVGQIDERKGIDLLVEAFLRADTRENDRLLVAGPQVASARAYLASVDDPRVLALDRYLDEDGLSCALSAIDVFVAPYRNHTGSASMVIRAAAVGRPTLAVDSGWFAYLVPLFGLGEVCDVTDPDVFARALERMLDGSADFDPGGTARALVDYGSYANICAHWSDGIRGALSLPRHAAYREWPAPESADGR